MKRVWWCECLWHSLFVTTFLWTFKLLSDKNDFLLAPSVDYSHPITLTWLITFAALLCCGTCVCVYVYVLCENPHPLNLFAFLSPHSKFCIFLLNACRMTQF